MSTKTINAIISFVSPAYNDANYLEELVKSIQTQDYPFIEQIIVNDGSTDNTKDVLDKLQEKYPKLQVIHLEKNSGACHARNVGAQKATGKYISFLPADAKLYPGMARIWVTSLEENPKYDFLYGGYRLMNENGTHAQDYLGDAFDVHILETANYIDGSFPLKKELYDKMGGWDEGIKSLQDWDFWLNAVRNHGAKGLYMPDVFFETLVPHPGGLSYDSHMHWLERTKQIKAKHNIPERKICVTAPGARFHGKNLAKILDADYKDMPSFKQHEYHMIYTIGFFGNVAQIYYHTDALRVLHWIGSDIMALMMIKDPRQKQSIVDWIKNNIDVNLTEFEATQKELEALGIKSRICPLPPRNIFEPMELPKKFTIAVYDPYSNKDHYFPDLIKGLAAKTKGVDWKFFGDSTLRGEKGNIEHCGAVDDIASFIKDTSCLLRVTRHDGLPLSVMEWAMAGRNIITNVPGIKGAIMCNPDEKSIKKAIAEAKKRGVNDEGAVYYKELSNHDRYKEFIHGLMKYDPREYWENRADVWHKIEGQQRDAREEYIIGKEIDELVKDIPKAKILDLGCGDGRWTDLLAQGDREYLGVDISEKLINYAKGKFTNQKFEVADMMTMPVPEHKFDVIFSYTSLLHIDPSNIEKMLERLKLFGKNIVLIEPTKKLDLSQITGRALHPDIVQAQQEGKIIYGIKSSFVHDYLNKLDVIRVINLDPRTLIVAKLSSD